MRLLGYCIALILFLLPIEGCVSEPETDMEPMAAGDMLPEFSWTIADGSVLSRQNLQGKVSVIAFFRTTCPDCKKELPHIQELYERYKSDSRVTIVLASLNEEASAVLDYWKQNGFSMPYAIHPENAIDVFRVVCVPQIYVSDKRNVVRFAHFDDPIATTAELEAEIESLLAD